MKITSSLSTALSATESRSPKGFTLLELLIVIAIIAILATIIIIVINPVEVLRRARDVQRMSDLATLKTSLALYLTSVPSPHLTGSDNLACADNGIWGGADQVFYSYDDNSSGSTVTINDVVPDSSTNVDAVSQNEPAKIDGGGWIPVDLGSLVGSSPISNLPVDPVNTIRDTVVSGTVNVDNNDLVYRYACRTNPLGFELNAHLESILYTDEDTKMLNDGGDNSSLYEMGTQLDILGDNNNF